MSWPTAIDYNGAIQNPVSCFSDEELRSGKAEGDPMLGLPRPYSGNFADVYRVNGNNGQSWAVKCFTREVRDLRSRYQAISEHLDRQRRPFTVEFRYLEEGIRARGEWVPTLKMRWIEGQTLNLFVADQVDNPAILDRLAKMWVRLAEELREADIAHGDLQHGNVLLVPGRKDNALALKLIDYDGMWVPSLAHNPPGEVGHPDYQHPQRLREGGYDPQIDRFSHLVIYTALRALALGGRSLWNRYDTGDNLLFTKRDFAAPAHSGILAELADHRDPDLRALAYHLALAAEGPLQAVPFLPDLVRDRAVRPLSPDDQATARTSLGLPLEVGSTAALPPVAAILLDDPDLRPGRKPPSDDLVTVEIIGPARKQESPGRGGRDAPPPRRKGRRREEDDGELEQQSRTGLQMALGATALCLGLVGMLLAAVPAAGWKVGLPLGSLGFLLGLVAVLVGAIRNGRGLGFPLAGAGVGIVAIAVALGVLVFREERGGETPLVLVDGRARADGALTGTDRIDRTRGAPARSYDIQLENNKTYRIDMVSNVFDSFLRLLDPEGREVARDDDGGGNRNARIHFRCPRSGRYRIVATAVGGGNFGPYTLTVLEIGPPRPLILNPADGKGSTEGMLAPDDVLDPVRRAPAKTYPLPMEAGNTYQIDLMSTEFDAFLRLLDPEGREVASDDDGGGNRNARITYRCPRTGNYRIVATALGGGRFGGFTLAVQLQRLVQGGLLTLRAGQVSVAGVLDNTDPLDEVRRTPAKNYTLQMVAGKHYQIDLMSGAFDAYLRLVDPFGKEVAADDDSGAGTNARIRYRCGQAGIYRIVATRLGGGVGGFTLSVQEEQTTGEPLGLVGGRATVNARLTRLQPRDPVRNVPARIYTLAMRAGRTYQIDLVSREFDSYLRLEDPAGRQLASDDDGGGNLNARITFTAREDGVYRIFATALRDGLEGNYTLMVEER